MHQAAEQRHGDGNVEQVPVAVGVFGGGDAGQQPEGHRDAAPSGSNRGQGQAGLAGVEAQAATRAARSRQP